MRGSESRSRAVWPPRDPAGRKTCSPNPELNSWRAGAFNEAASSLQHDGVQLEQRGGPAQSEGILCVLVSSHVIFHARAPDHVASEGDLRLDASQVQLNKVVLRYTRVWRNTTKIHGT